MAVRDERKDVSPAISKSNKDVSRSTENQKDRTMPTYDHRCDDCNKVLEYLESVSKSQEVHTCPECGASMTRLISSPNFNFKDLPKGHNLNATKRRELWNSDDPKSIKDLM